MRETEFHTHTIFIIIIFSMTAPYGSRLPLDILTTGFLRGGGVNPTPKPNPEDQDSVFVTSGDKVTQL
jgi:hypothetical protein